MAELEHVDRYRLDDFTLEGGSIHVDGEGTVITTEDVFYLKAVTHNYRRNKLKKF